MEEAPKNEFELSVRVGAPPWVADVGLGAAYRRTWESRGRRYVDSVADQADLQLGDLERRLEEDERGRDLFVTGLERSGQVSDEDYREAMARVVARALTDEAAVDEMAYLMAQLIGLEALHLRALRAFLRSTAANVQAQPDAELKVVRRAQLAQVAEAAGVSRALAGSLCTRLESSGLLERAAPKATSRERSGEGILTGSSHQEIEVTPTASWMLTAWGREVLEAGVLGLREAVPERRPSHGRIVFL